MTRASRAGSLGASSGVTGHRSRAKRVSRLMVDALEPRRLLAPWISTEVAGGTGGRLTTDVEVVGNRAYVAAGSYLEILDVSGTGIPIQLGSVAIPAAWTSASEGYLTVSGSYAYVWVTNGGAAFDGVNIIDISNPAAPTIVGWYGPGTSVKDVCIVGSYAYLVAGTGFEIVDISNPTAPTLKGSLAISDIRNDAGVTVAGSYAYVHCFNLTVVNIADPANPVEVGSFKSKGAGGEIAVVGTTAYSAGTGIDVGLETIDVSNLSAPVELGWYRTSYAVLDLKVLDSKVYLVEGAAGMDIINVADPSNPSMLGQLDTWGTAKAIAVAGSKVYVADAVKGLQIINAANPSNPLKTGTYDPPGDPGPIAVCGTIAYTGDKDTLGGGEGLHIFDIGNFDAPTWIGMRATNGAINDIAIAGSYLYATENMGLDVFNISTPSNPTWVRLSDVRDPAYSEQPKGIAISGSYAYIACIPVVGGNMASLNVVSIANPAAPVRVGSYAISNGAWNVAISGTLAYVDANGFGLRIIDISDPAHMVQVGSLAISYTGTPIILAGSRVYFGQSIIDVSNPSAPVLLNGSVPGYFRAVSGDLAYTDRDILNVSNPTAIVQVGAYPLTPDNIVLYGGSSALFSRAGLETIRFHVGENEPATDIGLSPMSVAENQPKGTVVGTFSSTCLNPSNTFTYTKVSGTGSTDNNSFTISGNQLKTNAVFDYETKSSYSIRIRSTDAVGQWFEKALTVTVTLAGSNQAPTNIALSNSSVAENQAVGTAVGTLSTTDPDVGNTFTYSLVSGTGSTDNASFAISGSTLQTAASFNYEAKNSYSIRLRTTDQGGLWFEKAFTISVINAAEVVPTISGISTDSGISSSDGITSDSTILINGSSEPGMTIRVYRDGVLAGTTVSNGSGNWTFDYTGTSLADGSYSFAATASDTLGHTTAASAAYAVTVDSTAPQVTAVYVRGSTWAAGYLSFLAGNTSGSSSTYGYAIPVGSGAAQLQTLPWRNLNQISVRFSEDVSVAQAQFAIVGSVGSYGVSGFSYNAADHVATWSLSAAIGPDKLYVAVPGSGVNQITDAAGNVLDGEWTNPSSYGDAGPTNSFPSGNGTAGGDFAFRFDVLPGDSTGGSLGKVNVADIAQTKSRSGPPVSISSYRSDFDGNNLVNVADIAYVKSRSGINSLPVNPPVLPVFGLAFSQVSLLLRSRSLTLW